MLCVLRKQPNQNCSEWIITLNDDERDVCNLLWLAAASGQYVP